MWNDDDKDFMKYNDEEKVCGLLPAVVIPAVAAAASKLPELELQLLRRTNRYRIGFRSSYLCWN